MCSISERRIPWSTRLKKPSVEAAWRSWVVISSMRDSKLAREILGMVRVVYLVCDMCVFFEGVIWRWRS